jgi:hypothetical protein
LEHLDAEVNVNSNWEMIRENIKISAIESLGYFELKNHKTWFDEGCSKLLDQKKQVNDRLCGLVVRVPCYRSRGLGSSPGTTRFSEK